MFPDDLPGEPAAPPAAPSPKAPDAADAANAADASDSPAPAFGEKGEVVISGTAIGSISQTTYGTSDAKFFNASFGPGVDYFILPRLSLGLSLGAAYGDSRGYGADGSLVSTKTWSISAGPRIGYAVRVGDSVSFWPRLTLAVQHAHRDQSLVSGSSVSVGSAVAAPSTDETGPLVSFYAPLLVHAAPHFFIGFGPTFAHDFSHITSATTASVPSAQSTTLGAALSVGGYFGGPDVAPSERPSGDAAAPPSRRFGEKGETVLTNDLGLSGSWSTFAGTSSSSGGFGIALGLDHFLASHVSFGFELDGAYSRSTGLQPNGFEVDSSRTSFGIGPRLGVDVPLASSLSFWPRVTISYGETTYDLRSSAAGSGNHYTVTRMTTSIYAPLLVHMTSHFFAGLGPTLSHDLSAQIDRDAVDNPATSFGASGTLGGWF